MSFGIVLPTCVYNAQRHEWARSAFESLAQTSRLDKRDVLWLVVKTTMFLNPWSLLEDSRFDLRVVEQPIEIGGTEQTLAWGTEQALKDEAVTHVVWMGDDALFNQHWLNQLEGLIERHPTAKAWSVYRSAHVRYHAPLSEDPISGDVLCRSLCGHGMTFSREEWKEWGIDWRGPAGMRWPSVSGGNTLHLHHACNREGERWCTKNSYVQHTGSAGVNVTPGVPEYALNWVGE